MSGGGDKTGMTGRIWQRMDSDASAERRGNEIRVDRGSADPRVRSEKAMLMPTD